jgi:hypothetical protein
MSADLQMPVIGAQGLELEEDEVLGTPAPAAKPGRGKPEPIDGLERALITKIIDMQVVLPVLWAWHVDVGDFRSPVCRQVWPWLIENPYALPSREQLRAKWPTFRFVQTSQALLPLAERVFKTARMIGNRG